MAEPDKNDAKGRLPHAMFRIADAQAEQAKAEHRKVDEWAAWRKLVTDFFEWLKQKKG